MNILPGIEKKRFEGSRSFIRNAALFFMALFALAFTARAAGDRVSRDAYVFSGMADARILLPFLADDATSASICGLIYNGLTKVDKYLNVVPDLAERWEISEDGLDITFYLRQGVKWHDGEPFTARDVKFTYDAILDPATGCPYISNYTDIRSIEIKNEHKVVFRYRRPYAPALFRLGMGIIPAHIFSGEDIRNSVHARAPVGTGPYILKEWKRGRHIILEAYPGYFEGVPLIKRFVYRVIPDQSVQFLELVTGGIDSMDLNPYQFLYRSETPEFKERIEKYRYLSHSYTYIGYNLDDPMFSDKRVRQALSYAINKRDIIDSVLLGEGEPCTGPFLKGSPYYDETAEPYSHNVMKAAKLLRQAGWSDVDGRGVLSKDGQEFRIILATNQGNQVREDAATVIQSQWAELGIKTEIQVVAWSAFLDQFINKRNFQAVILGWTIPSDPDPFPVWHSSSAVRGGLNFVSFSDEIVDELIEKGRGELDPEKRAAIYRSMHKRIAEEAPYTFLFFPYAMPAVQRRVKGIDPGPAGISHNFTDWYVPEDEVRYRF